MSNDKDKKGDLIDMSESFKTSGVPPYRTIYGVVAQRIEIGEKNRLLLMIRSGGKEFPLLLDYNSGIGDKASKDFVPPLEGDAVHFKLLPGRVRTRIAGFDYVPTVFAFENIGENERDRAAKLMAEMRRDPRADIIPFPKKK